MNNFIMDLRFAVRSLLKQRGFTIVVVLTLALGIGANTAIFNVVNAVLLRPLPFPNPQEIVLVQDDLIDLKLENVGMSVDELNDLQQRSDVFSQISAVWPADANLTGSDRPERIELLVVSPNYFSLLGVNPQLGRVFGPEDQAPGFASAVVISDGLWQRLFAKDPNVLGRQIYVDSDAYQVVGVMPPDFRHPGKALRKDVDIWATAGFVANPFGPPVRTQRILPGAIGRLKPGLNVEQAQAKLDSFVSNLRSEFANDYKNEPGWKVRLLAGRENLVGGVKATLLVLLTAVSCVLLIACVNIANLLLAKSSGRQREMAIRLALGANRRRLIVQLLTESLLLAFAGGVVALVMNVVLMNSLLSIIPANIPRLNEVGFDFRVLGFAVLVSIVTGLLFGLVPALQASRPDIVSTLREGSKGAGAGSYQLRFRGALIVTEFALSLVLLIAAGLLLRSFWRLLEVEPGFNPQNVLVARIWLPVPNNPDLDPYKPFTKRLTFAREVLRRASSLPGAQYAALSGGNGVPLVGTHNVGGFVLEGQANDRSNLAQTNNVSADYFRVLGTPLIRGRFFAESDDDKAPPVAIVDETTANRFWPNEDPIGKRIKWLRRGTDGTLMTVVGLVGDIKTDGFDQPNQPHVYFPIYQNLGYAMAVYLRTEPRPESLAQPLLQQVQAVDPNLPVFGVQSLEDIVADSMAQRKFGMQMLALFGVVALLLAAIGIYGVMSYSVTQRTREIGIRLALGAQARDVLKLVVRQGLMLAIIGVIIGLAGSFVLTRLMANLLFGVKATDPLTFTLIAVLLTAVALVASYLPARRATKVNPLEVLRYE
ncbi:MAG TPA: ABC transporter permease [Pyrinomonadaceae bacterium]|nr:ABC transporter permease [Pyrinomonadaceae bacterium]